MRTKHPDWLYKQDRPDCGAETQHSLEERARIAKKHCDISQSHRIILYLLQVSAT